MRMHHMLRMHYAASPRGLRQGLYGLICQVVTSLGGVPMKGNNLGMTVLAAGQGGKIHGQGMGKTAGAPSHSACHSLSTSCPSTVTSTPLSDGTGMPAVAQLLQERRLVACVCTFLALVAVAAVSNPHGAFWLSPLPLASTTSSWPGVDTRLRMN